MLKDIKKDLMELRGADVKIFGQATTFPTRDGDEITVDALEVIDAFDDYEIGSKVVCELLNIESIDDVLDLEHESADNSYNWSGHISNEFDYHVYATDEGQYIVSIKFHRFGDVRGNYTEDAFLLFEDNYTFHDVMNEQHNYFYVIVKGLEFHCNADVYTESIYCSAKTNEGYLDFEVYGSDAEDIHDELLKELEALEVVA